MIDDGRELAASADYEDGQDLRSELIRHAVAIQSLNQRIHQDSVSLSVAISALLRIAEAFDLPAPVEAENERTRSHLREIKTAELDMELSQAVERISDPRTREIMVRRLEQLGYTVVIDQTDDELL